MSVEVIKCALNHVGWLQMTVSLRLHPCHPPRYFSLMFQIKQEYQEVVLAAHQDPFFASHMYSNFGDLGMAVKVCAVAYCHVGCPALGGPDVTST